MTNTNPETKSTDLRSFIYVDSYKLASMSAQLFGGVTAVIEEMTRTGSEESESQKGPINSGRLNSDGTTKAFERAVSKVAHDHSYSQLESELASRSLIVDINHAEASAGSFKQGMIVRITARASFVDLKALAEFMGSFNEFGEALAYITTQAERVAADQAVQERLATAANRAERKQVQNAAKEALDPSAIAKKMGLYQDPENLKRLGYLLENGLGDHFELNLGDEASIRISALLDREYLREPEANLIKKYGRRTAGDFTLVGVVTQIGADAPASEQPASEDEDEAAATPDNLRQAIWSMATAMQGVEDTFFTVQMGEVIIDPIAVYRRL